MPLSGLMAIVKNTRRLAAHNGISLVGSNRLSGSDAVNLIQGTRHKSSSLVPGSCILTLISCP